MTRYDPFAYGEVRLDPNKQKQANAASEAGGDPEDVLFDPGESVKQAPPADSSWALLDEDVDGLLPGANPNAEETVEFGAEVLGEGMADVGDDYAPPAPLEEPPAPPAAAPAAAPEPPVAEAPVEAAPGPQSRKRKRRKPLQKPIAAAAEDGDAPAVEAKPAPAVMPQRNKRPVAAALLPIALCAGGGSAASWFWVMQSNPVMAGILGAATLVSALFAWLLVRG